MNKFTTFAVAILAASMLAGCNGTDSLSDEELVAQALNTGSIGLISDGNKTSQLNSARNNVLRYNNLIVFSQLPIRGSIVNLEWSATPSGNFNFSVPDDNQRTVVVTYPTSVDDETIEATLTVTATKGASSDSLDYSLSLMQPELTHLSVIREATINKPMVIQGFVTGHFDDWDTLFVQEGGSAITIRGTAAYFNDPANDTFEVGDFVRVYGRYTLANGWHIINNVTKAKIVTQPVEAENPILHPIVEVDWNNQLSALTGARVTLTGLKYQSGNITYSTVTNVTSTINFKLGDTTIEVRVPFNTTTPNLEAIEAFINGLQVNDEVDFDGFMGWNSKPQLYALTIANLSSSL